MDMSVLKAYLQGSLQAFERDPASSEYQRGYYECTIEITKVFFPEMLSLANTGKVTTGADMNDQTVEAGKTPQQKHRLITVTGDIGEYLKGQILKEPEAIVAYYRTSFKEANETELKLTDEQILEVIDSIPGDNEDAEILRHEKLEDMVTSAG